MDLQEIQNKIIIASTLVSKTSLSRTNIWHLDEHKVRI